MPRIKQYSELTGKINVGADRDTYELTKVFWVQNKEILKKKYSIDNISTFYDYSVMEIMRITKEEIDKVPLYEHKNAFVDRVVLKNVRTGELITIYIREGRLFCTSCELTDCEHIDEAWEIDSVREQLKKHGLKQPKSKKQPS